MSQYESQTSPVDANEGLFPGFPTLDVEKLIQSLIKRWWIAAGIFGISVLLALVYVLTAEKIYESTALINIEGGSMDGSAFGGIAGVKRASFDSLDSLKSIAAGITGGEVVLRVVEKLKLRDDPTFIESDNDSELLRLMSKRLASELIRGERNIALCVKDTDPKRAQQIAKALITEFQAMLHEQNSGAAERTRDLLVNERDAQAERVDLAEGELQRFREAHPHIPFDESGELHDQAYSDLQSIANRARDEANRLKAEYEQYLRVKDTPERLLEIGEYAGSESIQKLLLARDQKAAEFYKIRKQFTPKHPAYAGFQADLTGLNEQVRNAAIGVGESIKNRYESAAHRADSAQAAVGAQGGANLQMQSARRQFRALNRAREAALTTYDLLLERVNDTSVTRNVDETIIRTFSPPLINPKHVNPKTKVSLILAGFLGGITGLLTVLIIGLLDKSLSSKRQVESTLGLNVLAEVPLAFQDQGWSLRESLMATKDSRSLVSEGFRSLRTSLWTMTPRSVMFTSPAEGEGKTFSAASLALLQAQLGYRTLIVDADFRNPQLAGALLPSTSDTDGAGLAVQNSCQETTIKNLYLISLSKYKADESEPLNGEQFAAMLWEAYSKFDCVIVDSSPLGMVSDGLTFSRYVDAVVLVVKPDSTQAGQAQEAIKDLRRMRAPIAGCILNGVVKVDSAKESYVNRTTTKVAHNPVGMSEPSKAMVENAESK